MSTGTENEFRFRFSLRVMLIALLVLGAGFGILGRLFRQNPQVFAGTIAVLTSIVPYLLAVGTIFWIGVRRRQLGLCLWAALLIVIPFVGLGVVWVSQRYVGDSSLAMLDTKLLIEVELPKQVDAPWVWQELEARFKAGQLSQEEVDAAIGQLVTHMKSTKPEGWDQPLSWQRDFLIGIDKGGMFADAVKLDLCEAFYGADPVIQPLPRVRVGKPGFDIRIKYGSTWSDQSGLGMSLLWHIDRVLLDGKPVEVQQHYKHDETWSGRCNETVEVGEHEVTFEMTCAYIDNAKLIGLDAAALPPARWPQAVKRWKRKVSAPLNVFAADDTLVKLSNDPKLNPASGITVKHCVVQSDSANKKKVVLELLVSGPIAMSCDVSITLAGQEIPLGWRWGVRTDHGSSTGGGTDLSVVIESLDPVVAVADVTLTPNPKHIEQRAEVTEIWGKPITLYNVPVERLDLEIPPTDE